MGNNFLYLKVNNNDFFKNGLNPQQNNILVYISKDSNDRLFLMAKDENGKYKRISPTDDIESQIKQIKENINSIQNEIITINTNLQNTNNDLQITKNILNNQIEQNKQFKNDIKTILQYIVGSEISGSSESSQSSSSFAY